MKMTIKARIIRLERGLPGDEHEIRLMGWQDANFYPLTAEELKENKETGKYIFWREQFPEISDGQRELAESRANK